MAAVFDLVIRGGSVFDGLGSDPVACDVGIRGDRIVALGNGLEAGAREIDADGKIVVPGFVDLHTHYDGQVTWENRLVPSSAHGVTTAIIGNCGVGFAPCRPDQHDLLIRMMEGVEDIPHPVLTEGLVWNWESFPDYLDLLADRAYDMDIGAYLPHAALRVYVMGQRALDLESALDEDLAEMARIVGEAIDAGALGVATSRTMFHRSSDGRPIPTLRASMQEIEALAGAMRDRNTGVFQMTGDVFGQAEGIRFASEVARYAKRPVTFSSGITPNVEGGRPCWQEVLNLVSEARADGLALYPQILPRAVGMLLGFEVTLNPFYATPTYAELAGIHFAERMKALSRPEVRAAILGEASAPDPGNALGSYVRMFDRMFVLGDPPCYEQSPEESIAARAARMGVSPEELAYDLMLGSGGRDQLYLAMGNTIDGNLDAAFAMLSHPLTVPGLGDGGAHCATICDASYSTFMLMYFGRDRLRGELMPLKDIVRKLTSAPAEAIGLRDRGVIAPGYKADINVIDFDRLRLHPPVVAYDLPAGGRRLIQASEGYCATIVSGVPVQFDGKPTGELPGRLVRGACHQPVTCLEQSR